MKKITYLIDKFWDKTATVEERRELLDYLENGNAELRDQMEEEFQLLKEEFSNTNLSRKRAAELFQSIQHTIGIDNTPPHFSVFRKFKPLIQLSAAAVLLFLLTWSAYKIFYTPAPFSLIDKQTTIFSKIDTIYHSNDRTHEQKIVLEDGSIVTLYPGSKLSYRTHFDEHARDINLDGMARFEVARDTLRPFTVLANGYTTTALGTVFTVNTKEYNRVKVELLSGKVVVRSTPNAHLAIADTYLLPGDELAIDMSNGQWAVHNSTSPDKTAKDKFASNQPTTDNDEYLVFNKTPLNEVFVQISKKYEYMIDSEGIDLSNLSFTGSFKQTDSLSSIMNIICSMNDLEYRKDEHKIRITRK